VRLLVLRHAELRHDGDAHVFVTQR
jgi:hypothetical protein